MAALLTALFGVSGALFYGAADFFGGLSSRRLGALRATCFGWKKFPPGH